ncbi:MAG: LuxR C-terminal-related transcriptional regulator [Rhizobiaceae bacterium]
MTALATQTIGTIAAPLRTRSDLTGFLMQLVEEVGADSYLLVTIVSDQERSDVHIVASNWLWDAIQLAGYPLIASVAQSAFTADPGHRPRSIVVPGAPDLPGLFDGEKARLLEVLGHAEIYGLKLHAGRQRLFLLLSADAPGRIEPTALGWAQMRCCYALSQVPELLAAAAAESPLSDRERECLYWVSEGKTTDEVALILGVSSNTVNSYIAHAIQKLSASNRAAAIAIAIRNGMI